MTLAELVTLWRATLAPEVALAAKHVKVPQETWPATPKPLQDAWMARARGKVTAEDIAELMRVCDFVRTSTKQLLARFEVMAMWKPDPNMTRWLVDVFARPTRQPSGDSQKCFRRVFNLLIDHVDHAGVERLRAWYGRTGERLGTSDAGTRFLEEGFDRVLAKSEPRLAKARALTADEHARLTASGLLKAPAVTRSTLTLEALLEAVYANPDDDAPRAVLADLLQERGDPRGELIAIDLLPAPTEDQLVRRRRLLAEHGKRWFPPALDKVVKRDAEYQRGFLARGSLMRSDSTPIELATFRELVITHGTPDLAHAAFRGAVAWRGFNIRDRDHHELLRTGPPLPQLRRLGIRATFEDTPQQLCELLRPEAWPGLQELEIDVIDWGPHVYDVHHWDQPSVPRWIDDVIARLADRFPAVQRFQIDDFATFDRHQNATSIYLPRQLVSAFLNTYVTDHHAHARDRWFAWLIGKGIPVLFEHAALVTRFTPLLAPLELRVGKPPAWPPLA